MNNAVLSWGIKSSLIAYIGGLDDGTIEASTDAPFEFEHETTLRGEAGEPQRIQYLGGVTIAGHGGFLHLQLRDPWVEFTVDGAILSFIPFSNAGIEGDRVGGAVLALPRPTSDDTSTTWTDAAATLSGYGARWMGPQYQPGQQVDSVTFSTPR